MWILTLFFFLCPFYVSCSSVGTIRVNDFKLEGPDGDNCETDGSSGLFKCTVQAGKTVKFSGTWVFKGPKGQGITELLCKEGFEGVNIIRVESHVCRGNTGNIVYDGSTLTSCISNPIPQGAFQQDPYTTIAPKEQGEKKFTITCHAIWTDKSKTDNIQVASVIAVII